MACEGQDRHSLSALTEVREFEKAPIRLFAFGYEHPIHAGFFLAVQRYGDYATGPDPICAFVHEGDGTQELVLEDAVVEEGEDGWIVTVPTLMFVPPPRPGFGTRVFVPADDEGSLRLMEPVEIPGIALPEGG